MLAATFISFASKNRIIRKMNLSRPNDGARRGLISFLMLLASSTVVGLHGVHSCGHHLEKKLPMPPTRVKVGAASMPQSTISFRTRFLWSFIHPAQAGFLAPAWVNANSRWRSQIDDHRSRRMLPTECSSLHAMVEHG